MEESIIPIFNAIIRSVGLKVEIHYKNPLIVQKYLLNLSNQDVEVIFRKKKKFRSIPQNNYYHGVIVQMIQEEAGQSHDDIHAILKSKFSPKKYLLLEGKNGKIEMTKSKSTTELTPGEFEQYNSDCRMWAAGFFGLNIPLPNEVDL